MRQGLGLVFAGGGGKGAYQIGVWRYLKEIGLDRHVCAVSGTSVGALNAALFAAGDYEAAERVWKKIRPEQILTPPKCSPGEIAAWLASAIAPGAAAFRTGHAAFRAASAGAAAAKAATGVSGILGASLIGGISALLQRPYAFSREGLLQIMEESLDFPALQRAPLPCYATCLKLPSLEVRRFDLRTYDPQTAQKILLASSAIPVVFDSVKIGGERYCDGGVPGVGDNVPVQPLYDAGVETFLVVHLGRDQLVDHSRFPGARILELIPAQDLGGALDGTLDFTSEGAVRRMEQGYREAERLFGPFVETARQHRMQEVLQRAYQTSEQACQRRKRELARQREETLRGREHDGFDALCQELGISRNIGLE